MLRMLLLLCLIALPLPSFGAAYTIASLGKGCTVEAMNNNGQFIGGATLADGSGQPSIYQNGTWIDFRSLCNGANVSVAGINDSGTVVGTLTHDAPSGQCPRYTAFVWKPDTGLIDLDALAQGKLSSAVAINNKGYVVGESQDEVGGKAFIWDEIGGMRAIPTSGGNYGEAYDIDNEGRVLVSVQNAQSNWLTCIYDGSVLVNLAMLGMPGRGSCMNDSGQVGGRWCESPTPWPHGFVWDRTRGTQTINVDSFGPHHYCNGIIDINNAGQAIGSYYNWSTSETGSLIYIGGQARKLEDLLPANSGWTGLTAVCLNDRGQIAGSGKINGEYHAFVMTPVPEPSSLLCIASGLTLLVYGRRRSRISGKGV